MASAVIRIVKVENKKQLKQFVKFPWKIYQNDPCWVAPIIDSQISKFNPDRNPFFRQGEAEAYLALKHDEIAGAIVPWINHRSNAHRNERAAGFGFFEVLNDDEVAAALLNLVCEWARQRGATLIRGPLYFSPQDSPGVLIKGFDTLPPPLVGHTPPYYADLLEKYGFVKHRDAFAYRVELSPFQNDINNLPPKLLRVVHATQTRYHITIRNVNLSDWNNEIKSAMFIFNEALGFQREGVPMDEAEFLKLANDFRRIIDPKLTFFAEVDHKPIGLYVALPNVNQVLQRVNGHLFPFGWINLVRAKKYITMASTKILGVLDEYRNRGVDALFYFKIAEELLARGHEWVDYSLVAEENQMANRLVQRLGGTIYKICRTYKMNL